MYEKRFGLHRKPFQAVQKHSDYFASAAYKDLLPAILNALQSDLGVAVLTGPAGVGKSVTLESFRRALQPNAQTIFIRGGAVRNSDDLLYALYRHLLKAQQGNAPEDARAIVRRWDVVERLQRLSEFWGPLTILVDDVHLVEVDVFSELRSLLEEESGGQKLVRLLIAGPLLLEEVLAQPAMGDFAQKIRTHVFLEPLRSTESVDYVAHQVTNAGATLDDLFEPSAVEKIVVAADGVPRCLNLLADESLMICEETDQDRVTSDIVNKALSRLMHLPVTWNASVDRQEDDSDDDDFETASEASDSVVEIGGPVEEVSHGVIEFGAPSNEATCSQSDSRAPEETIAPLVAGSVDVGFDICEFVAEDEICRDNGVIEHIGDISDAINSVESTSVEFDFASDAFDGVEISAEDFAEEPDAEAIAPDRLAEDTPVECEQLTSEVEDTATAEDIADNSDNFDDLEHHLLLAASDSADAEADLHDEGCDKATTTEDTCFEFSEMDELDETDEVTESTYENEHLFAAILSKTEPLDCDEEQFTSFTRWEPAGVWPPVVAEERPKSASYATQLGNASPVFDRYTWCELGRTVSSEPLSRRNLLPTTTTVADWPPSLPGIAPDSSIAIEDACQDDQGLLPDLGTVIGKTSTHLDHADDIESITVNDSVGESLTLSELSLSITADEELSQPETQEAFFDVKSDEANSDGGALQTAVADDVADDSVPDIEEREPTVSLPMDERLNASSSEDIRNTVADNTTDDARSASITDDSATEESATNDDGSDNLLNDTTDVASLIANAVQRYISDAETVDHGAQNLTSGSPTSPGDGETVLIVDEEAVNESIEEYAPKLLQEARLRVISVLAAQGQLKRAAGAENTQFPAGRTEDAESVERPHLSISQQDDDQLQTEEQTFTELQSTGPRFRDLFTRLRKLKRRSA